MNMNRLTGLYWHSQARKQAASGRVSLGQLLINVSAWKLFELAQSDGASLTYRGAAIATQGKSFLLRAHPSRVAVPDLVESVESRVILCCTKKL